MTYLIEDFDIFEWAVIILFISLITFCGIALLYEYYGPTEQKEINGVLGQQYNIITNSNLPDGKFHSDGGAIYRISDSSIIWYLLPDIIIGNDYSTHMTKNVTLRTTLFDKIIIDAEGYQPPKTYVKPKCSDCGGVFKL